ncbi:hypothetical protein HNQ80_002086 [Anaerosolibacter carboniphilus]|uniref:Uncharacterized protein n=1 Tax=Anaerosolibacter carboniphilus TaxID=1417629 RepID=A0A841L0U5_9FIRM|nr:hypothetical protein [Anaerosolibacter carboniphilus]
MHRTFPNRTRPWQRTVNGWYVYNILKKIRAGIGYSYPLPLGGD